MIFPPLRMNLPRNFNLFLDKSINLKNTVYSVRNLSSCYSLIALLFQNAIGPGGNIGLVTYIRRPRTLQPQFQL